MCENYVALVKKKKRVLFWNWAPFFCNFFCRNLIYSSQKILNVLSTCSVLCFKDKVITKLQTCACTFVAYVKLRYQRKTVLREINRGDTLSLGNNQNYDFGEFQPYSVEISQFSYHSDFTWNQFWRNRYSKHVILPF